MKHLSLATAFIFGIILALSSCAKETIHEVEEIEQTDNVFLISSLSALDLFGTWKLETRMVNNITDASVPCCDYIELREDSDSSDLIGAFTATGVGYETQGTFSLDASASTIRLTYGSTQKAYDFALSDNLMQFSYVENNRNVEENWRKED